MRVLHVIQEMGGGGAECIVRALVEAGAATGLASAVVAAPGRLDGGLDAARYHLPILRRHPLALPRAVGSLRRATAEFRPDVIHCHNPRMTLLAILAGIRQTPLITSVHGLPQRSYPLAVRVLRLRPHPVVACGPGVAASLTSAGLQRELRCIPNAVDLAYPLAGRDEARSALGVPHDAPLAVSLGRLEPVKNLATLLRAAVELPDLWIALLGTGSDERRLKALAVSLGIAGRTRFPGFVPAARRLLGGADVVVLTSRGEGLPLALLEALAAGVPVVASAVPGIADFVTGGEHCLLVPPGDPVPLAAAIGEVVGDPGRFRTMTEAGRALVPDLEEMRAAYLRLYHEVAG